MTLSSRSGSYKRCFFSSSALALHCIGWMGPLMLSKPRFSVLFHCTEHEHLVHAPKARSKYQVFPLAVVWVPCWLQLTLRKLLKTSGNQMAERTAREKPQFQLWLESCVTLPGCPPFFPALSSLMGGVWGCAEELGEPVHSFALFVVQDIHKKTVKCLLIEKGRQ